MSTATTQGKQNRKGWSLSDLAINRPVTTVMVFLSCLVVGLIASRFLPLEYFPELDAPFLFIEIPYPGSTPREVERLITRPAEESLATLTGISSLNSRSSSESAQIFMLFEWGKDLSVQAVEAREKLEAIRGELPGDVRRINVFKFNTSDAPILTLRISSNDDLSEAWDMLNRNLVRPIERLPGVARVELQGVEPKEVRIELNAVRVQALNINLGELNERLQQANFSVSAGVIDNGNRRIRVTPIGEFRSVEEIRQFRINDAGVRLGDIADVTFEPGDRNYARHLDQKYAIGLEIFKERGSNMVAVGERVLKAVETAGESSELQGVQLFFLENQPEGVVSSLSDLLNAGLLGALLSILVLYFFLRSITTTLTVALAVPISITITLGVMYFAGMSLNILSMMGLMLAVGMLVDNAVVVSEAIFRERQLHPGDPKKAAREGMSQVAMAVSAGTLTTAVVFLPNLFGERDQIQIFLSQVALAIVVSLAASLLIAQTIIPLVASRIKSPLKQEDKGFIARMTGLYGRMLTWTLDRRRTTAIILGLVLVTAAIPMGAVKSEMFPEEVDRSLFLQYNLDANYSLAKIRPAVETIEKYLYDNAERLDIRAVYTYYDEQGNAQSSILLTDDEEATRGSSAIRDEIRENLPKIAIGRPTFDDERSAGAEGVSLAITGDSSERLSELLPDVLRALRRIDGLIDVKSEAGAGDEEVVVSVDRERTLRLGLDTTAVAQQIAVALRGTQLRDFRSSDGEVPVRMRFRDADTQDVSDLRSVMLQGPNGTSVPIGAVANFAVRTGPVSVQRQERETALVINASLQDEFTMDEAREAIENVMNGLQFPAGYGWKFGRGFDFNVDAGEKLLRNLILAVLFIFIVLAALFESLVYPISIITSILFSIIGVYWFFLITGTTFSLMANIGLLILIGVVVNNGIVLIDHINQLRAKGMRRYDAVVQGGKDRLRPILMTVGTTVLGLIPLCVGTTQIGGDGPPYFPMARAIVGGLVFSTVITLLFTPTIYCMLDDLRGWARNIATRAGSFGPRLKADQAKSA
ncbi:MAG: transporter [Lysobacteraceae bacterium]|nr:MAG: transporter [Xanthomonadaceae bacterium]